MYIVGIDIGKNHHEASIVSPEGKQIGRSLRFATTHKGADSLMNFIFKNIGNSPCVFGMEATGHYWYPIYSFLKTKGYTIYVINPIQSDSLRKMYIRQTKNDSIDSFLIAEVIRFGQFGTTSMADENILAMRQLCRYRDSVISSRTEIKLRIGTIMEQIFPEYEKQFSSLWVSTSMGILEKYLTPENIENAPIDELFEIMKYYEQFDCYLHTIPGIGIIGAATILAEIGDISRFKNSSALVAFAGYRYANKLKKSPTNNIIFSLLFLKYLQQILYIGFPTPFLYPSPFHFQLKHPIFPLYHQTSFLFLNNLKQ